MENARYNDLFPDERSKAEAFDQLAQRFYNKNFGTMSKADIEVLMFSLYIEQILKKEGGQGFTGYSNYTLAKELGIPQSKVENLKVKKQMQYPYDFDWKVSFAQVLQNARYENGKVKIQIPDINLFYEIKNAIEEEGGYVDITLTSKLLQVSPAFLIDLLVIISDNDNEREIIKKELKKLLYENDREDEEFDHKSFSQMLKEEPIETIGGMVQDLLNLHELTTPTKAFLSAMYGAIKKAIQKVYKAK